MEHGVKGAHLFTLWRNRVDFIDEDNSGRVLLSFFEGLSEVAFRFTRHLAHNFGTVNKEEESTGFVRNSTSHQRFTSTRRAIHQNTTGRLNTDRFEELWMTEWQFDKFTDLSHLLAAATNVVITDIG